MSYELLSEPIRRYVRDKRWEELRPIQNAAISRIMTTDSNYILASRTASGKTEAAFLPILSKVNWKTPGVKVLYISPLIALINDQFVRVEELCEYLDVPVTKWHGEANRSAKERLINNPAGVVLITPESLEAMFANKPYNIRLLFSELEYIVIDEIHSFLGTPRGTQLQSILFRLQQANATPIRIVGLSATIGDYEAAKAFTGNAANTKVLLDKTAKEVNASIKYFHTDKVRELPLELIEDLYEHTKDHKVLVFPNSRGCAEEVAFALQKQAAKNKGHKYYFSHHSSVNRELREYVENFAKTNTRHNFCISCTSTLELGIDIGSVDEVVQIDATHSIASLIQRVGRSGRRDGQPSNLILYATQPWKLLQSLACWQLYKEGFIEPPLVTEKPYDILLHQLLSVVKGHSGIDIQLLLEQLKNNFAFSGINEEELRQIVDHLLETGMLEKIRNEVIIGIDGERIVNNKDFYSVFKTEENFKVVNAGNEIGEIPFSPLAIEDQNILLAAKVWKIRSIDIKTKRIEVVKASDGNKPLFFGTGGNTHPGVRQKMLEILKSDEQYEILDDPALAKLGEMRKEFSCFHITHIECDRPLHVENDKVSLYAFSGSVINRTLNYIIGLSGITSYLDTDSTELSLECSKDDFFDKWQDIDNMFSGIDAAINELIDATPGVMDFSKWMIHLPRSMQAALLKSQWFDIKGAREFAGKCNFIENKEE